MRIQVFADIRSWPPDPFERLQVALPGVGPSLALAIKPLEKDSRRIVTKGRAHLRIIRYGVTVQMTDNAGFCPPQHLPFPQNTPAFACPISKFPQAPRELLPTCSALYSEIPLPGLPTVVCKSLKSKFLWLLPVPSLVSSRKTPEFNAARLFLGHFQAEFLQPVV